MPENQHKPGDTSSTRNLKRLFTLRNLMIAGELTAVLSARHLLDIDLPMLPILSIIAALSAVNLWTWFKVRSNLAVSDAEFFYQLCIDVLSIAGLLYFAGGATNPFAWLFLIPLIIAATVLSARDTWTIAALSTLCYSLLMRYHAPLGGHSPMHHADSFSQHVFGMWFGFVMSAGLIAWLVAGMARTLRERDRLLAEAREEVLRNEKLVALGTLATGAAHELGTPLATMAVVAGELERAEVPAPMARKLEIMKDQIKRCKMALATISASAGEIRAEGGSLVPVQTFIGTLIERWQAQRPDSHLETQLSPGPAHARVIAEQTLTQALLNLLNNAADASSEALMLQARWDTGWLTIDILDRGPGINPHIAAQVDKPQTSQKEFGLGLGLFLAHATIGRMNGEISLAERTGGGTHTQIRIPLTPPA